MKIAAHAHSLELVTCRHFVSVLDASTQKAKMADITPKKKKNVVLPQLILGQGLLDAEDLLQSQKSGDDDLSNPATPDPDALEWIAKLDVRYHEDGLKSAKELPEEHVKIGVGAIRKRKIIDGETELLK